MILKSLLALPVIVNVAVPPGVDAGSGKAPHAMSAHQKSLVMRPLVHSATDCILRAVAADPRLHSAPDTDIRDLIVESMSACADAMRAMIDAHDQLYGEGSGEQFFMGPYLDTLPTTVLKSVKDSAP